LTGEVRLDLLRYIHLTPHASNELSHAGSDGRRPGIAGVRMDGRQPRTERPSARAAMKLIVAGSRVRCRAFFGSGGVFGPVPDPAEHLLAHHEADRLHRLDQDPGPRPQECIPLPHD